MILANSSEQKIRIRVDVSESEIRVVTIHGAMNRDAKLAIPEFLEIIGELNGLFVVVLPDGSVKALVFSPDIQALRDLQISGVNKDYILELWRMVGREKSNSKQWKQMIHVLHEYLHTIGAIDEYLGPQDVESSLLIWSIEGGRKENVMYNKGEGSPDIENLKYLDAVMRRILGGRIEQTTER